MWIGLSLIHIYAKKIVDAGITRIKIRSVLNCRAKHGVCKKCYGSNLANGKPVGESVSAWVLADVESRKIMRLSAIRELDGTGGGELCKTRMLNKLRAPQQLRETERRLMRYSDTDINGHVNNIRYADFACDTLDMDRLEQDRFLSQMQIGYLAECRPGDLLTLETGEQEDGVYVRGTDQEGKPRFEAALGFAQALS